jgi:hypothetical protein
MNEGINRVEDSAPRHLRAVPNPDRGKAEEAGDLWHARFGWRDQMEALGRYAVVLFLPAALLLSAALVQQRAALTALFRDVNSVTGAPFYTGFYSQLGAIFWCSAAAVCIFTWWVLFRRGTGGEWPAFLLSAGALSTLLLLDDLFLIHETVLPRLFPQAELAMYLFYALASVALVVRFRAIVLRTSYLVLLVALAFLGLSEAIDTVIGRFVTESDETFTAYRIFIEDGGKFLGIVGWFGYFAGTCAGKLMGEMEAANRREG